MARKQCPRYLRVMAQVFGRQVERTGPLWCPWENSLDVVLFFFQHAILENDAYDIPGPFERVSGSRHPQGGQRTSRFRAIITEVEQEFTVHVVQCPRTAGSLMIIVLCSRREAIEKQTIR